MTKLESYKCERCGKVFSIPAIEAPPRLTIDDFHEARKLDLCTDCMASHAYWMKYVKEFDSLADKLVE